MNSQACSDEIPMMMRMMYKPQCCAAANNQSSAPIQDAAAHSTDARTLSLELRKMRPHCQEAPANNVAAAALQAYCSRRAKRVEDLNNALMSLKNDGNESSSPAADGGLFDYAAVFQRILAEAKTDPRDAPFMSSRDFSSLLLDHDLE